MNQTLPDLPEGWVLARLGHVLIPSDEKFDPKVFPNQRFVGLADIESNTGRILGFGDSSKTRSTKSIFRKGDLLYGKLRPYLNKVWLATVDGVCSTDILVFKKNDFIDNGYLAKQLLTSDFVRFATQNMSGVQHPRVNYHALSSYMVKLAPLQEQHRISARIDELLSRLGEGIRSLENARAVLKAYRHAVLKYAFEGKLTQEWRETHQHELRSASLLESIDSSNQSQSVDTTNLPSLPALWVWTRLGRITDLISGKAFKKSEYARSGVRLFQIANVTFGRTDWTDTAYLPQEYLGRYPQLVLRAGDVLMALNRPIIGGELKIAQLNKADEPAILYQRVGKFTFMNEELKRYFLFYARSPSFINRLKTSLQGVDQPFVNKPNLLQIEIPLAPLTEQERIIDEINRHLSVSDKVEATLESSLQQAEKMRMSILKKAFQGKLVRQDPTGEPASVMIERIAKLRANTLAERYEKRSVGERRQPRRKRSK
jgi:type I restriction enzyme S subunit